MREPSIFRRLFFTIVGLLLALLCLSTVLIIDSARVQIDRDNDKELITDAHILLRLLKEDLDKNKNLGEMSFDAPAPDLGDDYRAALTDYTTWRAFRVWKNHQLMFRTNTAQPASVPEASPNFSEKKIGDARWRTYALYVPSYDVVIEVSENLGNRQLLLSQTLGGLVEPLIFLLPLIALIIYISLQYGLAGVSMMERQLQQRQPDDLRDIHIAALPKELRPLQQALNFLFGQLTGNLVRERQLIDNAAHELRTPLAGIQLHAQLAAEATDETDRAESMDALFSAIKRANILVDQLLSLSRITADQIEKEPVALFTIANRVLTDRAGIAAAKHLDLSLDGERAAIQLAHEGLMTILLGVLIDNAIKYTPEHGAVSVFVARDVIEISDTGPGIPAAEREKVFERFYQITKHKDGSGLGLSIAKQICTLLGIRIELNETVYENGLLVRLSFPS